MHMDKNNEDLSGLIFGRLTAISIVDKPENLKSKGIYYLCECQCGTIKAIRRKSLVSGNTRSCGCLNLELRSGEDITGKRFGYVTVLKETGTPKNPKYSGRYYLCLCDCNNEFIEARKRIVLKSFKSCGCIKPIYKKISCNSFVIYEEYVVCKDNKGRTFEVDIDDYHKIRDEGLYWYVSNRKSSSGNIECYVESRLR